MTPKILVPYDFSATADSALAWAVDLQRTSGAGAFEMLYAISSIALGTAAMPLDVLLPNQDEILGLERSMSETAQKLGAKATVKVLIQARAVGEIILDEAHGSGADLIVMGTHGRSGVKRFLLGSVAEHLVRHANCPVVTVRGLAPRTT